ncbi:gluconolactonase [Ameyamaea chiangmaiensis NBRC 103196]|uniref:SMP-30/gluconolactonase/LRE family protein n=1 Tax=Ameyamaea chiangmaiensis TaxID=442969 RepID=A0A850P8Q8_9PROT|nr:SMP-30/gluconolactonase/LRE family protein [Ameyamaea chiangmaiensis]MBS4075518.1 SMP-30/gluconolactonase/LRE family protein [Ameyamaea chiangmaiensis]NVN38950.1 SMP-30/gluconolactonase/LRE family protein [Ameyamaea chiangmaiensis]GBQ69458.1 gluconolactonase [Ameyamaea chiangmaiensis NBRC 103196]
MQKTVSSRYTLSRRGIMGLTASAVATRFISSASAASPQPPSVVSVPPREWGPGSPPVMYPDPDIIVLDDRFKPYLLGITQLRRVWDKGLWLEGPAWSEQGNYLVFSDVHANRQYRYLWETGAVTVLNGDSGNSNGNAFDFEGRQIIQQDLYRRIIRREHNGVYRVLADSFDGKPLNSPNDMAVHPDGSVWFTDPTYGDTLSEGHPDAAGGPTNPGGRLNPLIGQDQPTLIANQKRELPSNCYRIDKSGRIDLVISGADVPDPNGIAFSPDYRTLYVASTTKGPGTDGPGGQSVIYAFDVEGTKVTHRRVFHDMVIEGVKCPPDGFKVDVDGNLWCGVSGPLGYRGVVVISPDAKVLGRIRLPQLCANLTFAGPKRNMLMMMCGQSIYTLQVQTQGAAPS